MTQTTARFLSASATIRVSRGLRSDGVLREFKGCMSNLFRRVLVPVCQPRQAAHAHHDDGITVLERHLRGRCGDTDVDIEPLPHRADCCRMARIQTRCQGALSSQRADGVSRHGHALDGAATEFREHRVRNGKTEKDQSAKSPLKIIF